MSSETLTDLRITGQPSYQGCIFQALAVIFLSITLAHVMCTFAHVREIISCERFTVNSFHATRIQAECVYKHIAPSIKPYIIIKYYWPMESMDTFMCPWLVKC